MKQRKTFLLVVLVAGAVSMSGQQPQSTALNPFPTQQTQPVSLTTTQAPEPSQADKPLSEELNAKLPQWLQFSGQARLRAASVFGDFFRDRADSYLLTRFRLDMQIKPTAWMRFYFQGQDSHTIGAAQTASLPPLQRDAMDLRLAYVDLGDIETRAFRLRAGRQELAFGEERLIGPANWLDTPRSFDGLSTAIRTNSVRLDAFAASVVKIHDGQFNENTPGSNIYGIYSSFTKLIPETKIEPYFFWRRQSGLITESKTPGISNFGTAGVRWVGKIRKASDYDFEIARQAGSLGTDTISAWAGHWLAGYTFGIRTAPRLFAEYNYATGDHNAADGRRGTFDQLLPSGHDLYGLTDQVGWKNIHHVRMGIELQPRNRWKVSARYNSYWLADPHDALYNAASIVVAKSPAGSAGKYVGQELDFLASYDLNRWTAFAAGVGHLFPGAFLKNTTPGFGYTYPYSAVTYRF